jgi:rhamnosyltransferase subunit B
LAARPIIVVAFGSAGDVQPMLALADALRRRGHDVTLLAGGLHAAMAQRLGLRFVTIDTQERGTLTMVRPNAYQALSQLWHRIGQAADLACRFIDEQVRLADATSQPRPLLVGSSWAVGVRLAQERFGLPAATVHMSPSCILSSQQPPVFRDMRMPAWWPLPLRRWVWSSVEGVWLDPICKRQLDPLRKKLRLTPVRRVMSRWIHSPDLVLGLFPDWFCAPQPDWPANTHLTGFPLADQAEARPIDQALEGFLSAGAPPIVFTTGSAMRRADRYFSDAVQVCQRLGRRGLLLTRHTGQLPALAPFMMHQPYAPLSQVLPRACALVSHAGIGSASMALLAGVPQLLLPYAHDQFDNARWFAHLGVGTELPSNAGAGAIGDALQALLSSPQARHACAAAQARMREQGDAVLAACVRIEALMA